MYLLLYRNAIGLISRRRTIKHQLHFLWPEQALRPKRAVLSCPESLIAILATNDDKVPHSCSFVPNLSKKLSKLRLIMIRTHVMKEIHKPAAKSTFHCLQ